MKHIPNRMCVACRRMRPTTELLRVVADKKSQRAAADIHKKKFGRGAYVCRSGECIAKAEKKKLFARHLGCGTDDALYAVLRRETQEAADKKSTPRTCGTRY